MMPDRWKPWWHRILFYPTASFFFGLFGTRVLGCTNVPRSGGLLIIANHQSYLDPPLVGVAVRRRLCYVARKTLFRHKLFAWLIDSLGAVPIDQDTSGTDGIKAALRLLKAGNAVLVFPEGARTPDGRIHDLKPGIVVLIRRAKAKILPIGIAGAYESWPIHGKSPRFSPFFLPATGCGLGVVIGQPVETEALVTLPPDEMLTRCRDMINPLFERAEKLRR